MAQTSLLAIRNKVRLITRSMSTAQLSDAQLDQYINTYVLYDFPETLRLFNLKTTFSFYTLPFVDTYSTTTNTASPLYNFTNKYLTTDSPIYIAGYNALFSQSREEFYGIYPLVNSIASIGTTGNGVTVQFTGTVNSQQANVPQGSTQFAALLQNNVLFDSIDANGNGLAMQDSPILDLVTGNPTQFGLLYNALTTNEQPFNAAINPLTGLAINANGIPVLSLNAPYKTQGNFPSTNYINYVTGQYIVTFASAPAAGIAINSQTVPLNPAIPQALLFYDGQFIVRPLPDQTYRVDMEVWIQPTELLSAGQSPELEEWWQLIAWNAAKKVFEDRMDYDSIGMILPSLKEQENLVIRRTIVQQTGQRVATIYSEQGRNGTNQSGFGYGGGQF
jgi:hypothetical protein